MSSSAANASARVWGFETLLVASGASELEVAATNDALQLIASEPLLATWSRAVSYRVVTRADVQARARAIKRDEIDAAMREGAVAQAAAAASAHAEEGADASADSTSDGAELASGQALADDHNESSSLSVSTSSASVHLPLSPSSEELIANLEMTPQVLADALQRLVLDDKTAFLAHTAALAASRDTSGGDGEASAESERLGDPDSAPSDARASSGALADFAADHAPPAQGDGAAPTRIYLLHQYPSSFDEMQALLRTGEAESARHGDLPLLPLIDGALLVVDAAKEVREGRRKSLGVADERRKSVTQRQLHAAIDTGTSNGRSESDDAIRAAAAVPSVFQTANALVRECFDASRVGGLEWSDFVFADVSCSSATASKDARGLDDLAKELLVSAEALATHKYAFKRWVATTTMLPIPALASAGDDESVRQMLACYEQILEGVFEASVGVSTVLFAVKEAVALAADAAGRSSLVRSSSGDSTSNQPYVEEFIAHNDNAALRLAVAYATFVDQHAAAQSLPAADSSSPADPCSVLGRRVDEVEKEMWAFSDLPGVGNSGRKGMPVKPALAASVRSIQDTELQTFTPMDVAQLHVTQQLLQFEELLGGTWKGKLQSTRSVVEALDCTILPQRLAQILGNFPSVYKHYDAATDTLLLATLAATAPGRLRSTTWTAKDHVRHRPAFKDWKRERAVPDEYLTPRTLEALGACVPLSSAELALLSEKTFALFPSDQSVVRVYQTPRGDAWLNVYQGGDVFGFRQVEASSRTDDAARPSSPLPRHRLQFCASFDDASQLHITQGRAQATKPDGYSTIAVTNTFPNGLTITACSDGSIVQRYVSATRQATAERTSSSESEIYRLIIGKGTVLRAFASGARTVLLANGDVQHFSAPGTRRERVEDAGDSAERKPLRIVDPATSALVETRANGVVVIAHMDGARATYHTDGTCMRTNGAKTHVLVTKPGFADVGIDLAVNITAMRHACGERVAVTKGGLRVRSTVDVYDGTRIALSYNTKVIAQVNGRVSVRKPSGAYVVAKDSGRIEYQGAAAVGATVAGVSESAEDADLDVTTHHSVYYFDCARGQFELCDHEQNQFRVDFGAVGSAPRITVDLAGVVSDADATKYGVAPIPATAVVNDPIEPHLLLLHGDGTGHELVRPRDVASYVQACDDTTGGASCRRRLVMSAGPQCVYFETLESAGRRASDAPLFNDTALQAELARLARPVNAAIAALERVYFGALQAPRPQFTVVRTLAQREPLSANELLEMHAAVQQWRDWQRVREATKEQYTVADPRDADTIAQQVAVQKKVLAAYKAARSRKRLEKQRAREATRKAQQSHSHGAKMETVQESDEQPHADGHGDDDDDDGDDGDAFEYSSGDDSGANGDDLGDDVDDPDELLWTAFAAADSANAGRLSLAQTRHAMVHALGVGVQTAELLAALRRLKLQDPSQVSFDTFAELVGMFKRESDESSSSNNNNSSGESGDIGGGVPALVGWQQQQPQRLCSVESTERLVAAAGSATEAIQARTTSSLH